MPNPPAWNQIEQSESFSKLNPVDKQRVIDKWRDESISFARSLNGYTPEHKERITDFANSKISELTAEAPSITMPGEIKSELQETQKENVGIGEAVKEAIAKASEPVITLANKVSAKTLADAIDVLAMGMAAQEGAVTSENFMEVLGSKSREPTVIEKVAAGGQQAAADAVNFFASPLGVATLGMGGMAPALQKTVTGLFVGDMLYNAPQQVEALSEAINEGDEEKISKAASALALTGAFIYQGGKHLAAKQKTPAQAVAEMMNDYVKMAEFPEGQIIGDNFKILIEPKNIEQRQSIILKAKDIGAVEALKETAQRVGEKINLTQQLEATRAPSILRAPGDIPKEPKASIPEEQGNLKTAKQIAEEKTAPQEAAPLLPEGVEYAGTLAGRDQYHLTSTETGKQTFVVPKGSDASVIQSKVDEIRQQYSAATEAMSAGIPPSIIDTPVKYIAAIPRFYSEPLANVLARIGGDNAKEFSRVSRIVTDRGKELAGSISQVMDKGLIAAGKFGKATTWLEGLDVDKSGKWAINNFFKVEQHPEKAPDYVQESLKDINDANLNGIGKLAEKHIEDFQASGKYQRMWTVDMLDIIRSRGGDAFDTLVEALSSLNNKKPKDIKHVLNDMANEIDSPGSTRSTRSISQEFTRYFDKIPTHIRRGRQWIEVIHSRPFDYLQKAFERVPLRVAFLEMFPKGDEYKSLADYRKEVVSELQGQPQHFDRLVRAMHGLPIDTPILYKGIRPSSGLDLWVAKPFKEIMNWFAALKLTGSTVANASELIAGNTPQMAGMTRYLRGLAAMGKEEFRLDLERKGAINQLIYDWSFDPSHPLYSLSRNARQHIKKYTGQNFLNEIQEKAAAAAAEVWANDIVQGRTTKLDREAMRQQAREFGLTDREAQALSDGTASSIIQDKFTRMAASYWTAGNIRATEVSRLGSSRTAMNLFRYQSYPMMKMNVARNLLGTWLEMGQKHGVGSKEFGVANARLARFIAGTAAQGAGMAVLAAIIRGGWEGLAIQGNTAKDDMGRFLRDSLVSGFGGPIATINYAASGSGAEGIWDVAKEIKDTVVESALPVNIAIEMSEVLGANGPYKDMDTLDRVAKYFREAIPGGRIADGAMALVGLSDKDRGLEEAQRSFYRWRRQKYGKGFITTGSAIDEYDLGKDVRPHVLKAVEALKAKSGMVDGMTTMEHLLEAIQAGDLSQDIKINRNTGEVKLTQDGANRVAASLRGRKILRIQGQDISLEDEMELRKRLGNRYFDKLNDYDLMLDTLATVITKTFSKSNP